MSKVKTPQFNFVDTKDKTVRIAFKKLFDVADSETLIVKAHQIIEAILYKHVRIRMNTPKLIDDAGLTSYQTICLARAMMPYNTSFKWFWDVVYSLNSLRNKLAHNIEVADIQERIHNLVTLSRHRIDTDAPDGATTSEIEERKQKQMQFFFLILCGVAYNLFEHNKDKP